ncbi:MAG: hypothetical protein LC104_06155 [Bacteroidales bacterium]|nr:hypothetical protein [Bacteroidales bacterium]
MQTWHRQSFLTLPTIITWGLFVLTGCGGGPVAIVSGTITVAGKPLTEGSIHIEPAQGEGQATGAKIVDGHYTIAEDVGMPPGEKHVTIRGSIKTGKQVEAGPPTPKGTMIDEIIIYPPIGMQPDVHTITVEAGENTQSFDLPAITAPKRR